MALLMIADDDPVVRHILTSMLKLLGHEVVTAASGGEAVTMIREREATGTLPRFLFLDLLLQDMNGLEVLEQIRGSIPASALPSAILSANSEEELDHIGPAVRPEYFLEKPFTQEKIAEVLSLALGI